MKQITEDYVSYEAAVLLKEKGFDVPCDSYYEWFKSNVTLYEGYVPEFSNSNINHNQFGDRISRPSQSLALKWLREVHKLFIEIVWIGYESMYSFNVTNMKDGFIKEANIACSYNEAVEAALLYVLKNLI